ncbi:uncharacterized protein V1510DRAFT_410140 [Dipodascopsis tothii]|uniref:uncharacterized protein n=1 Tax=Dipodascopsis tothii TaxID=44089 RepID=UPI0034CD9AFB
MGKYWCKPCKTFVIDSKLGRTQHETSGRHKASMNRTLRDLHRNQQASERSERDAKAMLASIERMVGPSVAKTNVSRPAGAKPVPSVGPPAGPVGSATGPSAGPARPPGMAARPPGSATAAGRGPAFGSSYGRTPAIAPARPLPTIGKQGRGGYQGAGGYKGGPRPPYKR